MAATTPIVFEYVGAMSVVAGTAYSSDDFTGTCMALQMKTKGVSVSINGTPMFNLSFDDVARFPATTTSYIFNKDCVVALLNYDDGSS